ncbi:MAG: ABC transporter ATP-binding protein [Lachnospiraceae bacterium]|jgi:ABC-2 type transport system ATP-binding protein|nr:ABC transporter ATP-binding protein [Lachnospiraceae bacterium]
MDSAITVKDLNVKLKGFELKDISLEIPRGVVVGLVGRNGAGKTTLINTLTDVYIPAAGSIIYGEDELSKKPEKVKAKIGVCYDSLFYPPIYKPEKIAKIIAPFYEDFDMDKWKSYMERFNLDLKKPVGQYSKGMQMKFMLSLIFARNAEVLILDEPTAGLDPAARAEIIDLLQEYMVDEDRTVIFSTHITSDLDKIADYIVLMENGQVVLVEEKDELMLNYGVVQVSKEKFTSEIEGKMIGVKEKEFGYIGLTKDVAFFEGRDDVKVRRAIIEDLLIYEDEKTETNEESNPYI